MAGTVVYGKEKNTLLFFGQVPSDSGQRALSIKRAVKLGPIAERKGRSELLRQSVNEVRTRLEHEK